MIDEKKIVGGGQPLDLTGKALNEDALEDVSGGAKSREWAESAWDWVKPLFTDDDDKEQQP